MVPQGHAECSEGFRRSQTTRSRRCKTSQKTPPPTVGGKEKDCRRRDSLASGCRLHHGGVFSGVAPPPGPRAEEEQQVAHVYRLHEPQQSLPQRSFRPAKDRSSDRLHSRMRAVEFLGCLLWIPPNKVGPGRPPEDRLHHALRSLLLPNYDIRLEKCWCHLSALHAEVSPQAARQKRPRLRG